MKKTAKKLISALLVLAMVISTFSPAAIAAPAKGNSNAVVETTPAADNSVGETADTLLAAASALASIEESSGNVHKISKDEIEEDALLKRAEAELKKAGFTEEQNQQLLYFFSEYKKVISGNPDVFGVEAPYFLDKDTNERPIESLLAQVGYTQESLEVAVEKGEQTFDEVLGMVQLFYYAAEFGVQMLGDQVKAARDEALKTINDDMTDVEKILALNDWIAAYSQFDWSQLLPIKAPQQGLPEISQQIYQIMYGQIKQQVYDGAKNDLLNNGISEENADTYATAAAESYMDDAAADGGKNGNTAALEVAGGVYSLWGTMVFGPLALKNAVCIGYSNAFAYLVQSMYPEIYKNNDGTWKTPDEVNVDANGKHENAPYVVDFVRIQFSDTISLFGSPAGSFSSFHFWNALKVNGKWYYVDSCYTDIYVACMLRDRVETDGNMNHVYFMFSHDSCEEMYDGYYSEIDSLYGNENNSKLYAGDKTYEDAWFAFAKSPIVREGNYYYYAYDSTDIFDMMSNMGGMGNNRSVSESGNTKAAEGDNNNNWGNNNWNSGSSWQDAEYKLVRRKVSLKDSTDDFEELINFNEGTVLNLESGEMEANDLIKTFYAKHEEDAKIYPSLVITTAYYNNVLYFNLSNNVFSYDLKTGAVSRVLEYNKVMGKRDPSMAFGGLAMTKTTDASEAAITVNNAPIAAIAIKDGDLIVSVATTYGLISGKAPYSPENPKEGDEEKTAMDFYSSYGYFFAETNYNPDYTASKMGYGDEINDNDEFMWSANIIDTISMSHLAGGSHNYTDVTVPESCITDEYSEMRCSTCGKIQDGSDTPMLISESADTKAAGEDANVVVTVKIVGKDGADLGSATLTDNGKEGETYSFTAEEVAAAAKAVTLDGYTVDESTAEAVTGTYAAGNNTASTTVQADKVLADANVVVTVKIVGKDGADLGSTTLTDNGKEGETYSFTAEEVAAAAKTVTLDGYTLDETTAQPVSGTYAAGSNTASTTVQADKVLADANVVVTVKIVGKDGADLGSTTLTDNGKEGETYSFTAEEVTAAAKTVTLDGYTVDESTAEAVTGTYKAGDNTASTTVQADKVLADASVVVTVKIVGKDGADLGSTTLTDNGKEGETYSFTAEEVAAAAKTVTLDGYTLDETTAQPVSGTYKAGDNTASTTVQADKILADASVVVTIKIVGKDGADLGSTTLTDNGKEGETYSFTAEEVAAAAKTVTLDKYAIDESTAEAVTGTYKAGDNTASTTVQADRVYADAKVVLTINIVGKDDANLGSTTLEKTGKEEDKYTFTAEEIAEAAKKVSLDGYTVDASTAKEVTGTYAAGDNTASTTVEADKHVTATLTISIINSATAEDDEPQVLGTATLTKEGVAGEKATFTADEIKKAAEETAIGDYTVDTTNSYADTEVEYSKEKTVTVTATKNLHGHGHRYIKFSESYYTRKDGAADDDVRDSAFNKGTSYVCLDCMKAYEEEDFTADVRTERDTIYDYQKELSGKKYAYWTWSSDGTEAALFLIPEELKSIMLDCVWENRLFSSRTEATPQVTGMANNCTTGLQLTYTATVTVDGTQYSDTRTITYPEMAHSETLTWTWDLDEEGNVKPLADANGNLTCAAPSLKLTCNTCGTSTDVETTITTQTNSATCVYPGLTFFMATGKNGERNYADMQMMISAAPLGHDYGDDDFCDRIVDAEGHTCGTERIASTVTLANKTATYTGKAISAPTAKVEGSEGKVTYTYYSDKDCKKKLSGAPVKPGVYYVKAKVATQGDYKAATSKAAKLTIIPRSAGTPKVANTSSGIKVSWKKVDEAVGYRVYRKSKSSDDWTRVATIEKNSTLSWTNTTKDEKYPIKAGKTYIYTVRAYVNDSCLSSYDKTGVKMKRLSQPSVSVKNVSEGVKISWKKLTGASGYYVYYRTSTKDEWKCIKTIKDASTVSYNYKKANTNGKKYYFTVKAYSGDYKSSFASKTYYRLSKPSISSVKNSSSKKMTVAWSKNSKATGYQFEYATNSKFDNAKRETVKNVKTLSKAVSAAKGKTYYVRLRTYKKVDGVNYYSAWSSSKKIKISK